MERQIPNEPGALMDALLKWNDTPEGKECLKMMAKFFRESVDGYITEDVNHQPQTADDVFHL